MTKWIGILQLPLRRRTLQLRSLRVLLLPRRRKSRHSRRQSSRRPCVMDSQNLLRRTWLRSAEMGMIRVSDVLGAGPYNCSDLCSGVSLFFRRPRFRPWRPVPLRPLGSGPSAPFWLSVSSVFREQLGSAGPQNGYRHPSKSGPSES